MSNEKVKFEEYIDDLTRETGYEFDKVSKGFAYQAAKNYHEQKSKEDNVSLKERVKELEKGIDKATKMMSLGDDHEAFEYLLELLTNNQQSNE